MLSDPEVEEGEEKEAQQKGGVGDAGWQVESSRRLDATRGGLRVARLRRGGEIPKEGKVGQRASRGKGEIAKVLYGE